MIGEVIGERQEVQFRLYCSCFEQRFYLGSEVDRTVTGVNVIKRLDAETIARDEQLTFPAIPDRESKHAAQVLYTRIAVLLVQVQDRFRVAVCLINVASIFQHLAEIRVVVDFAVKDDVERAIFIGHRLMTRSNIDDTEPAMAQANSF